MIVAGAYPKNEHRKLERFFIPDALEQVSKGAEMGRGTVS
jgi:hypothetical protein